MAGDESFTAWLKQRRKALDLTQAELAHRVGCSIYTVQRIEEGVARPSRQLAELLAAGLEIAPADRPAFIRQARALAQRGPAPLTGPPPAAAEPANPYKGLRAFQEADAPDFFGRDMLTRHLLERLREEVELARFLAVVGPSGAGKSSVVRAGLIPALRAQALGEGAPPLIADLTPGAHPLEELEAALARVAGPATDLHELLWADARGLARAARHLFPDGQRELVLLIDQFEELFTLVPDEALRARFVDQLFTAVADAHSRLRVIVTLRADFYDRPLVYLRTSELLGRRTEVVGPLTSDELYQAIAGPAERHGLALEQGLASRIMEDVAAQPGTLPLLQYSLTELFERREGRTLTLAGYQASGGVAGALGRRAESLFAGLGPAEQAAARQLFLRLVTPGAAGDDTRRRVFLTELLSAARDEAALRHVLDLFGRYRLLTFDRDPRAGEPTVEVAHEALLSAWARLRGWLDAGRERLLVHRRLLASAGDWQAAAQDPSFLAYGARLAQFADLTGARSSEALTLTAAEQAYVAASLRAEQQAAAAQRDQQARELALQRRAANRLRGLVAGLALFLLVAAALATFAFTQQRAAETSLGHAEALRLGSAADNLLLLHGDPSLVALLGIRALRAEYSPQADAAVSGVAFLGFPPRTFAGHSGAVRMVAFSPDGQTLATGSDDTTVRLWDLATGQTLHILAGHTASAGGVAFSPDGKTLATGSDDGTVRLWDVASGQPGRVITSTGGSSAWLSFTPDGKTVLASDNNLPHLWDVTSGQLLRTFTGHTDGTFPALSPDGKYVFTGSLDSTARLWDAATGRQLRVFPGEPGHISGVAYSPDGRYVAAGTESTGIHVWDAASGQELKIFPDVEDDGVAFSPDSRFLASAGADRVVRLWDLVAGQQVRAFTGHSGPLYWVTFSSDGKWIASASWDNTARVWSAQEGQGALVFSGHTAPVSQATFSPDGKRVVTAGEDHTARIWDARTGQPVLTLAHPAGVEGAVFSPDGTMVLTAGADKIVRLWDAATGRPLLSFTGHTDLVHQAVFSPDGQYVVATSWDSTARVWDAHTARLLATHRIPSPFRVNRVAFAPDGKTVATSEDDGTARIWDPLTGQDRRVFQVLHGQTGSVSDVAFAPDGKTLLTTSLDETARLWDIATGQEIRTFAGHAGLVLGAAFSPDGRTVLTSGADQTARIWDVQTGQELRRFSDHSAGVGTAVFSPDGRYVLTASGDKTARLRFADYHDTLRYVCGILTRDLTPAERTQFGIPGSDPTCPP